MPHDPLFISIYLFLTLFYHVCQGSLEGFLPVTRVTGAQSTGEDWPATRRGRPAELSLSLCSSPLGPVVLWVRRVRRVRRPTRGHATVWTFERLGRFGRDGGRRAAGGRLGNKGIRRKLWTFEPLNRFKGSGCRRTLTVNASAGGKPNGSLEH